MARKILNRKELREENDAAEERDADEADSDAEEGSDEESPKKKKPAKAPVKRKSRSKTPKEIRLKAFWGVFGWRCLNTASGSTPTKRPPN